MSRLLKKHPAYTVSITVVLLNITVMILLGAHLLNSLQAAKSLSQSLGTNLDWYALPRGEKVNLFGPLLVIGLMGVGVLFELGKRPVAALFNPLRLRVQRLVDHRFNRAHYDAEAIIAGFTLRLREAVDLETVRSELLLAVNGAVQPAHASLWIKPPAPRARA